MSSGSGNQVIYVCGEQNQPYTLENPSLRDLIISNLAVHWSIRTHPTANALDPRNEVADMYQTIARSHVFVFIYSKETIEDSYYLNQYGIAKAYGVPVVGIRMPSYILPNPLPEQYYFTEIIDYSSETRGDPKKHGRLNTANKKRKMLTDVLIHDFRNAMVYATDFHKSCIERLLHKVNSSYIKSEKEKRIFAALSNNNGNRNPQCNGGKDVSLGWKYQAGFPKCPKCGFVTKRTATPTLQRASSTGSLLRKSNAFENESAASKNAKRTALHPSTIQISSPYLARSPLKIKMRTQPPKTTDIGWDQNQKEKKYVEPFRGTLQPRATTVGNDKIVHSEKTEKDSKLPSTEQGKEETQRGTFRKQARVSNSWTEKLRNKLRRQSSLPIVPTTYLLTTPDGLQTTMHFVKYPPEKKEPPSPRGRDVGIFSEDEEGEIHISRVPSPDAPSF